MDLSQVSSLKQETNRSVSQYAKLETQLIDLIASQEILFSSIQVPSSERNINNDNTIINTNSMGETASSKEQCSSVNSFSIQPLVGRQVDSDS